MSAELTSIEKTFLLRLARESAQAALENRAVSPTAPGPDVAGPDSALLKPGACFVTLKRRTAGHELRGCLGQLEPVEPLWQSVARMAGATATRDVRFSENPVRADELPSLKISISVLHPKRSIATPLDFELGQDGIIVEGLGAHASQRGVFLPQVATEYGWSKEQFLNACCSHKAGLSEDAWRDAERCRVWAFRSESIEEE